jgi:hypothetical protein
MSILEINYTGNETDAISVELALNTLVKNLNKENLSFIAELSKKKDINERLRKNKTLIKAKL